MKTNSSRERRISSPGMVLAREVFIVRLWRETRDKPAWRGQVQHIRTGQVAYVRGLEDLLALFSSLIEQTDSASVKPKGLK